MSWRGKKAAPVPMVERFAQAYRAGEVRLDSFTQAELASVTLDPDALSIGVRGPALQSVAPLLVGLEAERAGDGDAFAAAAAAGVMGPTDPATLAAAAADLESRGYIRPGWPAPSDVNVPAELAGWSTDPAAAARPRAVAIGGDLGIITRMRAQPYWVAEASASPEPAHRDPAAVPRRLVGRMYAAYKPQAALAEVPAGPAGSPHFAVLWQHRSVLALLTWCGIDLSELQDAQHRRYTQPVPDVPTATVAAEFTSLTCLRIAHPLGERVDVRTLIAAGNGDRHWMLTGERAQIAARLSVDQLGEQVDVLLRPPDRPEPPGQQGGTAARPGS
jgi:hypothetical protein